MKQFSIFKNPQGDYKAVKIGWSWPGFCFGVFWALAKKLWMLAGVTLGVVILISIVTSGAPESTSSAITNLVSIVCCLLFGYMGNSFCVSNLESRGYEIQDTIIASNNEGAIALHISNKK